MTNTELTEFQKNELAIKFLEHHRFYTNRLWQYFAAILLVNSIVLGSIDKFEKNYHLLEVISIMSVALIGVFYHLINLTDTRIDDNMRRVNELLTKPIPNPQFGESQILWTKLGIILLSLPYYYLAYQGWTSKIIFSAFSLFIIFSEYTVWRFAKRLGFKKIIY